MWQQLLSEVCSKYTKKIASCLFSAFKLVSRCRIRNAEAWLNQKSIQLHYWGQAFSWIQHQGCEVCWRNWFAIGRQPLEHAEGRCWRFCVYLFSTYTVCRTEQKAQNMQRNMGKGPSVNLGTGWGQRNCTQRKRHSSVPQIDCMSVLVERCLQNGVHYLCIEHVLGPSKYINRVDVSKRKLSLPTVYTTVISPLNICNSTGSVSRGCWRDGSVAKSPCSTQHSFHVAHNCP